MSKVPPSPTEKAIPELEAHLGYWLRRVSNQVSGTFARALQARHVSVAEWVALRHLSAGQGQGDVPYLTPGELAERLGVTRGAVSKIIDKLEAKSWVVRFVNTEDNRMQWLALTPQGNDILPELAQIADSNDEKFFACLDTDEQATLRRLLQKLTCIHQWTDIPID